ncbi:hypothetical protein ABPG75_008522 [Micractinium tetrahymenae]
MDPRPALPPGHLMRAFRQVLMARGIGFCDEADEPEQPQFPPPPADALHECVPLLLEGVEASSTDAPSQGIGCTLEDDATSFWSSTGSQDPDCAEFLLYKLSSPLCLLRYVQLAVFRAQYQWGAPVYPPSFVSFQVGPSPWSLAPPAVKYPVAATDAVQTFPLPADLPLGRYLRINLHGKRQRQLEDMQFYHAIQRVEAFGRPLGGSEAARLRGWLAAQPRALPAPGVVPQYAAVQLAEIQQQQHHHHHEHGQHYRHHEQGPHRRHHPTGTAGEHAAHAAHAAAEADDHAMFAEARAARWRPGQPELEQSDPGSPSSSSASSLSFTG